MEGPGLKGRCLISFTGLKRGATIWALLAQGERRTNFIRAGPSTSLRFAQDDNIFLRSFRGGGGVSVSGVERAGREDCGYCGIEQAARVL